MQMSINHFMWAYQQHFRFGVGYGAKLILNEIKPGLQPEVFLVGVRIGNEGRLKPACMEPEIHHWARSSDFYDVLKDVESIQQSYIESEMMHSHPIAQANHSRRLFRRALRDAVLRRLEACQDRPRDIHIFAGMPVERDGFLVLILISVRSEILTQVPTVDSDTVMLHEYRSFHVPRSLIEAAVDEILISANQAIIQPDAGAGVSILGSTDEILRRAAVTFFSGLLNRMDRDSLMAGYPEAVFDAMERLALMPYESSDPKGTLIFADKGTTLGTPVVTLATSVELHERKALRKLLVLANGDLALQCNCQYAFALVQTASAEHEGDPPWLKVHISGRGKWMISIAGRELMAMTDTYPSLPKPAVDEARLAIDLQRLIPAISPASAMSFAAIGRNLAESGHGAIIIIGADAAEEAIRLANDGLSIVPLQLSKSLLPKMTEIDGAVLCTPDGICHAIGVILDGNAARLGDRSRGSRFNSALRYVHDSKTNRAAFVVSEDGGLDLLPKLKPALAKANLLSQLEEMELLANSTLTPPNREREVDLIQWFEKHAFYLNADECKKVNGWIKQCDGHHPVESIQIIRAPLSPDPEFDSKRDLI